MPGYTVSNCSFFDCCPRWRPAITPQLWSFLLCSSVPCWFLSAYLLLLDVMSVRWFTFCCSAFLIHGQSFIYKYYVDYLGSSFEILSGNLTLRIYLMHLFCKVLIFFLSLPVVFHISLPYNKTVKTRLLNNLTLVWMENVVEIQVFLSIQNCDLAFPSLLLMSSSASPFVVIMSPRY